LIWWFSEERNQHSEARSEKSRIFRGGFQDVLYNSKELHDAKENSMAVGLATSAEPQVRQGMPKSFRKAATVYAIAFDMDIEQLRANYGDPYNNAYLEIRKVLARHGFAWQQGSVYFGDDKVTAVTCVLAAQDLARALPWFASSVRDIRMLRIEELNDLMPAVEQAAADGS